MRVFFVHFFADGPLDEDLAPRLAGRPRPGDGPEDSEPLGPEADAMGALFLLGNDLDFNMSSDNTMKSGFKFECKRALMRFMSSACSSGVKLVGSFVTASMKLKVITLLSDDSGAGVNLRSGLGSKPIT